MADWDFRRLRVLRTLADLGTVTATAQALCMTPSAVSQQLSGLAKQLDVPLVAADGRGVRLTDAARLVLRHVEDVFAQLERAESELAGHRLGECGQVRVGAFGTAIAALVVPAVRHLRRRHPGITVRVHQAEAAHAYELLARGAVELAVTLAAYAPPAKDPKFTRVPLLADPLDVALPARHPLAAAPRLRLADLADEAWICAAGGPAPEPTTAVCQAAGFAPVRAHAAADWPAVFALVAAGMGVALVPRMATAVPYGGADPAVAVRVLHADRPRRYVVAAVRRGAERAPALARALDALQAVAATRRAAPEPAAVQAAAARPAAEPTGTTATVGDAGPSAPLGNG
ncbi:LysR family transcriptional regulator [Streptomyces sp. HSW2009]|uniref:LysR family transcriptional regulator n=1 Tax=Streptomyces sp. HSW2009 TaxID=3142890 RepID=UPI0032EAAC9F